MRDEVIYSLKWVAIGKIIGQSIRWITTIFTLRLLFPEDYTIIALGSFFSALLWSVSTGGITSSLIREPNLTDEKQSQFFSFMIIAHLLFFAVMQLTAPLIASFYDNPAIEAVLQVTSFNFLIVLFGIMQQTQLNRNMNFKQLSMIDAFSESVGSLTTVSMAYLDFGFWSIVVGNLVASSLKQVGYLIAERTWYWPSRITSSIKEMVEFAKKASFFGILAHLTANIDIAIAGIVMSNYEVGIYQFAIVVAMIPASKVLPLIRQVAFPAYARIQNDPARQCRYFQKSQRMAYLLFIPVFWGIAACATNAVPLVFGDKWQPAGTVILLYCLSMPFRSGFEMFSPLLKSSGNLNVMISNMFITLIILIPCFYFIGTTPEKMAIAWLVGYSFAYIITTARACNIIGLSLKDKWKNITAPVVAGVAMFAGVFWLGTLLSGSALFSVGILIAQVLTGAIIYLTILYFVNVEFIHELGALVRRKAK
ncbi:lipopolysaccharide biosynthesis protein [Alteromonas sp. C1M14]|uniref:lipopolysaccharide biosynthesis protein n=1 Tax=Alteromonas sp. C1M14 TaxID=2841567 RepID=UPI001C085A9C|nr:lipopolysaccharide biosynthesis protein [Alteromonas sp. C1M14]